MSKNILIRDLSPEDQERLEFLKQTYSESTSSKLVIKLLEKHIDLIYEMKQLQEKHEKMRTTNVMIEGFYKTVKYEMNLLEDAFPRIFK